MTGLSTIVPWDLVANGYSEVAVEYFRGYNTAALNMVEPNRTDRLLDVCCGPGTLVLDAADRVAAIDALDFSENMIAILRRKVAEAGVTNITPIVGDGQALPYEDERFDLAFSMFGLMFFPDRAKGYREIYRTLKPGGRACIASWAPVDQSPMTALMFGALRSINPDMPPPKTNNESLENPDVLAAELSEAGFRDVKVESFTHGVEIASAQDFWNTMTKGSAPVLMMKKSMGDAAWIEKSKIAVDHVAQAVGTFPAYLTSDAWFGIGRK